MAWGSVLFVLFLLLVDRAVLVAHAQMENVLVAQPSSGLPPSPSRPPSIISRSWNCGDCSPSRDDSFSTGWPQSYAAWCLVNCWFSDWYEKSYHAQAFLGNINRWLQQQVSNNYMPSDTLCSAWNAQAASFIPPRELWTCNLQCNGEFPIRQVATMSDSPCQLAPGHISITPVLDSSFEYQQTYMTDKVTWKRDDQNIMRIYMENLKVAQSRPLFTEAHWRAADDASGTCGACTGGACLQLHTVHMTGSGSWFVCADLPAQKKANIFGTKEHLTLSGDQLKSEFKWWAAEETFLSRMKRQAKLPESQRVCSNGVSSACLANKGAVTGRACSFQGKCFSRASIFGTAYVHANTRADFVVRGRAAQPLKWFRDQDCTIPELTNANTLSFDFFHNSFQVEVPLECKACPNAQATSNFDPDTGARACDEPFSPFVLELSLTSYTGCSDNFVLYKQVECDLHHVSVRSHGQARLRCTECASLRGEDGFARGSHRPFITSDCNECMRLQRIVAQAAGRSVSEQIREMLHPCKRCDNCRNCSKSSTFDAFEVTFCRPLDDMLVVEHADWQPTRRLAGRDQFKRTEYVPTALDPDHFRDAEFQQQACRCNNRHKYAQFCGEYALRDQDAWMTRSAGEEVRLSSFTDATELAGYSILRAGVCQPCLACPVRHFNGACEKGREGNCALCRILASCTATRNPYLHHSHAEGCEQTIALSDYECRECPVWAKIGQDHMLLIGCGDQNLRRWRPTASAFDGVLDVGECRFDHGDAPATPMCRHAGVALERKRPFGNYSALMPYCPPGWFFKCAGRSSTAPWDPECCAKCDVCPPEKSKNTATWRACSGASDVDTQSTNCVDRCENNMYEVNNTCLYCTTCKEGEL